MARIRTIKPEFWKHEDLSALPEITHMLAAALLNHADDEGYFNANPALVKAECLPLRESSVSTHDSLQSLAKVGFIELGVGEDGKRYGRVVKFDEHQRVNRPTPSKIKAMQVVWESSVTTHAQLSEPSPPERKGTGKGKEQGREEETSSLRSDSSASLTLTPPGPPPADLSKRKAERIQQIAEEAQAAYNRVLAKPNGELTACTVLNKPRLKAVEKALPTVRAICRQLYGDERVTPEFWTALFETAADDEFHSGRKPGGAGHENWKPDFEYLLRENVIAKLFDRAMTEHAA
ncbi:hypothetical protein [Xanthomonas arboricola]|uniref:Uncharacterized protein n=1 Tax=Xanthomonas campestris pv. juglandis TaxID=195709 RepID=A0A8E4ME94_XANCJ|nr:hypothetical protein [Xanthomonas arboricola]OAH85446.1 hypothetical protein AXA70_19970 [Xanthomonas arboricola pv. juglandis]CAD1792680.1 hypothetical protein XSP_002329 [Xanthomonas arboricola pv. juglandis]CAD2256995.1 hypothetical protein X12_001847 [Xanthomonas arboricola]CAD7349175.1 hypothetical protein X12_002079 [Xanthomonas arboricola]SUZ38323.1 hypothetical protein CPBF1521_42750 [Xanthomonas arboricola pv. juglandis]